MDTGLREDPSAEGEACNHNSKLLVLTLRVEEVSPIEFVFSRDGMGMGGREIDGRGNAEDALFREFAVPVEFGGGVGRSKEKSDLPVCDEASETADKLR
jgi:hypothetical protein